MLTKKYPEFNSCQIRVENFRPGEKIRIATDASELSGSGPGHPAAIWACFSGVGNGAFNIEHAILGRPGKHPLGLSLLALDNQVLTLLVEKNMTTTARSDAVGGPSFISRYDIQLYIWATAGTTSITLYCEVDNQADAVVQLCGQSQRLSDSRTSFKWINQYSG